MKISTGLTILLAFTAGMLASQTYHRHEYDRRITALQVVQCTKAARVTQP